MTKITFSKKDFYTFEDLACGTFFYVYDERLNELLATQDNVFVNIYFKLVDGYNVKTGVQERTDINAVNIMTGELTHFDDDAPVIEVKKCDFS